MSPLPWSYLIYMESQPRVVIDIIFDIEIGKGIGKGKEEINDI